MRQTLFAASLIAGLMASNAVMVSNASAEGNDPLFFGGTAGFMKPHGSDNDSGMNIGARLGRKIQGNFSWEADLNLGIHDGQLNNRDWSVNSVAGYGVYRTDGDVHFKAKLGVAYWDDDLDNDFNLSAGVGIGIRMGRGVLDVEYTQINNYTDYVTVGYSLPF
jgi:outer membrane immunogenic protein